MAVGISGLIKENSTDMMSTGYSNTIVVSSFSGQKQFINNHKQFVKYLNQAFSAGSVISIYVDRQKGNIAFGVDNKHAGFAYKDVAFLRDEDLYLTFHTGWKE